MLSCSSASVFALRSLLFLKGFLQLPAHRCNFGAITSDLWHGHQPRSSAWGLPAVGIFSRRRSRGPRAVRDQHHGQRSEEATFPPRFWKIESKGKSRNHQQCTHAEPACHCQQLHSLGPLMLCWIICYEAPEGLSVTGTHNPGTLGSVNTTVFASKHMGFLRSGRQVVGLPLEILRRVVRNRPCVHLLVNVRSFQYHQPVHAPAWHSTQWSHMQIELDIRWYLSLLFCNLF